MKVRRIIRRGLLVVLLVVLAGGITLYLLASRKPSDYHPLVLSDEEREAAQGSFIERLGKFIGDAQRRTSHNPGDPPPRPEPYEVTVAENELNEWLAALPPTALTELRSVGLSQCAAAVAKDRLTFYARWSRVDKVVGIDLVFEFDPERRVSIRVKAVRLGDLPAPSSLVDELIGQGVERLRRGVIEAGGRKPGWLYAGIPTEKLHEAAATLVDLLNGKPRKLALPPSYGNSQITDIRLTQGLITIRLQPLTGRPPASTPTSPGPARE